MTDLDVFLARAEGYAAAAGLTISTVSHKLLNDGKGLDRLKGGGSITLRTLARANDTLDRLEAELSHKESAA